MAYRSSALTFGAAGKYARKLPSEAVYWGDAGDKVLDAIDAGVDQWCDNGAVNRTLFVPADAAARIKPKTNIPVLALGTGTCTIQANVAVTLNGVLGGAAVISGQYQGVLLTKLGPDEWVITGSHGGVT